MSDTNSFRLKNRPPSDTDCPEASLKRIISDKWKNSKTKILKKFKQFHSSERRKFLAQKLLISTEDLADA